MAWAWACPLRQLVFHSRALPQGDPRRWPARDCRPLGRLRDLEVIDASDMLDDAVGPFLPVQYRTPRA